MSYFMIIYISYVFTFSGKDCGELQAPQHGSKTGAGHLYSDKINFTCNAGYNLIGKTIAECLNTGSWSAQVPQCQRKC